MSISFEKAKEVAQSHSNSIYYEEDVDELIILENEIISKNFGWYFFSQSKRYLETQSISDIVLGNGMFLVKKENGEII